MMKAFWNTLSSFDNERQMTSPPEDDGEDDMDSLVDPGDPATQVQREAAVAKIRPSIWLKMQLM